MPSTPAQRAVTCHSTSGSNTSGAVPSAQRGSRQQAVSDPQCGATGGKQPASGPQDLSLCTVPSSSKLSCAQPGAPGSAQPSPGACHPPVRALQTGTSSFVAGHLPLCRGAPGGTQPSSVASHLPSSSGVLHHQHLWVHGQQRPGAEGALPVSLAGLQPLHRLEPLPLLVYQGHQGYGRIEDAAQQSGDVVEAPLCRQGSLPLSLTKASHRRHRPLCIYGLQLLRRTLVVRLRSVQGPGSWHCAAAPRKVHAQLAQRSITPALVSRRSKERRWLSL